MSRKSLAILLATLFIVIWSGIWRYLPLPLYGWENDEYIIYSLILGNYSTNATWIVQDHTDQFPFSDLSDSFKYVKQSYPEIDQETFDDFKPRNSYSYILENRFDPSLRVVLLKRSEIRHLRSSFECPELKQQFGRDSYLSFSRVGFNARLDQALVYVIEEACMRLASRGYFLFLVRTDGKWKIKGQHALFTS